MCVIMLKPDGRCTVTMGTEILKDWRGGEFEQIWNGPKKEL
jgi:hypothetical protein